MSRWRIILVFSLLAAPVLFLAGLGLYTLYVERRWGFIAWWPMSACLALAFFLAWRWQRKLRLIGRPDMEVPSRWTERDQEAWKLVEARAQAAEEIAPARLGDFSLYITTAQEMALELARAFHPGAIDPVGQLTIPELLAVVELAARDLAEMVDKYLPAGHLLTLNHWRQARQAAHWYQKASNFSWLVTGLFNPVETGLRYSASSLGVSKPWQKLQENLLLWFYTAYVHRVGAYLIEVNSGRLRVGAKRYRELLRAGEEDTEPLPGAPARPRAGDLVTLTVMGQVKAGKSSFINAMLGEERARTDILPATDEITRYELKTEDRADRLLLLDTVGYAHSGPKEDQINSTLKAAQSSDLLILILHARNPARQADLELLQAIRAWSKAHPDLKAPPILAVLTHIDLLTPAMEWSPPYNWQAPDRVKEQHIHQAVAAVKDQLGEFLDGCIPTCTAAGRVYGVEEWFLPALSELLDDARAVSFLRCLRREAQVEKFRKVIRQVTAAGLEAAKILWHSAKR